MILSGTVISIEDVCCDTVTVNLTVTKPFPASPSLKVPEEVGCGYLADEWYGTFSPGTEADFNIDDEGNVLGFRVGDYHRGEM